VAPPDVVLEAGALGLVVYRVDGVGTAEGVQVGVK
jgi:hypothetical protein